MRARIRRLLPLITVAGATSVGFVGACQSTPWDGPECGDNTCEEPQPPQPTFENQTVVTSRVAPPPISGGTLLITENGDTAVVADPDRDRIVVVDLSQSAIRSIIETPRGAEPGRAVEDGSGLAYVALRTAGNLVVVDLASGAQVGSVNVCPAPRGLAFDAAHKALQVACAGGELVTVGVGAQPVVERTVHLGEDLRDVVVSGDQLLVSHFRSATLDRVDATGKVVHSSRPQSPILNGNAFSPTVAWRTIGLPDGRVIVVHQQAKTDPIFVTKSVAISNPSSGATGGGEDFPSGSSYGGTDCSTGIVHAAVTAFDPFGNPIETPGGGGLAQMTLPVDVAVSALGDHLAIVAAGSQRVLEGTPDDLTQPDGCTFKDAGIFSPDPTGPAISFTPGSRIMPTLPEPIAVAYGKGDALVVQTREPARLEIHDPDSGAITRTISLGGESRLDTGHALFHGNPDNTVVNISCASCHPEGRDDGHTWIFSDVGQRRTQSLSGFSPETAPFHWGGDLSDVGAVMDDVFVQRMGNAPQSPERKQAIGNWMSNIPSAPQTSGIDAAAAKRGQVLFNDSTVGCASCHSGSKFTNNATVDVGTGQALQVPGLLGVRARAPYMHDGCAETLKDRFTSSCDGGDLHGTTSQLAGSQIDDLVSYLETL